MNSTVIYYNPHPKDKHVNDCVRRAFTKVTGKTYQEISKELLKIKNLVGSKDTARKNVVLEFVRQNKWKKVSFPAIKGQPRMNGERFALSHPKGTYVLRMAHHIVACVDGYIYDTWDSSQKCVYNVWVVSC